MTKLEMLRKDEKELAEDFKKATDEGNALADLLPDPKDKSKVMDDLLKELQISTAVFYLARIAEHTAYIADALDKRRDDEDGE